MPWIDRTSQQFSRSAIPTAHPRPAGGTSPADGNLPPTTTGPTALGLRFIENYDYRQPSNDPNVLGSLGPTGLVDPNLKPMKQHEMVVGADWALAPNLAFETRYSRKRLDRTIEDTGIITPMASSTTFRTPEKA